LNRIWVIVSVLWMFWCLIWPYYARHQDLILAEHEAQEEYRTCLSLAVVPQDICRHDRVSRTRFLSDLVAPPTENVYSRFAGAVPKDAIAFYIALCGIPVLVSYCIARMALELVLLVQPALRNATSAHVTSSS
jgi:hypothetical protein